MRREEMRSSLFRKKKKRMLGTERKINYSSWKCYQAVQRFYHEELFLKQIKLLSNVCFNHKVTL